MSDVDNFAQAANELCEKALHDARRTAPILVKIRSCATGFF
jgi:hypothetical protein